MTYIKSIELENFKSFAGRTKFDFINGFNIIAGANGSGKSNIVDALLFVFGESSKKEMRSEVLSDLIFNGGKHLKEAEYAKATVTLDNSNKDFKGYEEKEISISRKIDKSGKSVFRINGKASTREEIINLLSQIKMNSNNFNIVPQGDILNIATAPPDEKLSIVKGLAGIDIFEEKKDKAMSELKKVEENISTIQTVQNEKKKLLEELENEKKRADEYKDLVERARVLTVKNLLLKKRKLEENYSAIEKEMTTLQEERASIKKGMDDDDVKALRLREELENLNREAGEEGEAKLLEKERELFSLKTELERAEMMIKTDREQLDQLDEAIKGLEASEKEINGDVEREKTELEASQRRENELTVKRAELQRELSAIEAERKEKEKISDRLNQINKSIYEYKLSLADFPKALEIQDRLSELKKEIASREEERKKATIEFSELKPQVDEIQSNIDRNERLLSILSDRLSSEREEINTYNKSILLVDRLRQSIDGVYGSVETLFTPKSKEHVTALFSAMGRRREFVIVDSQDTANKAIDLLKNQQLGALTFIPLDSISDVNVPQKPNEPGVVDFLINLVDFDERIGKAIRFVFYDTLLVDSFENAKPLVHRYRMVTLDGTVFEKAGTIYGGYMQRYDDRNELVSKYASDEEEFNKLKASVDETRKSLEERQGRLSSLTASINFLNNQINSLRQEENKLEQESRRFPGNEAEISRRISELESEKGQLEKRLAEIQNRDDRELRIQLEDINKEITSLDIKIATYKNRLDSAAKLDLGNLLRRKQELMKEKTRFANDMEETEGRKREINEKLRSSQEELAEHSSALERMRSRRSEIEKEINGIDRGKTEKSKKIEEIDSKINSIAVKQAEAKAKLDVVLEELSKHDVNGIEVEEGESQESTQRRLNEVQAKINGFGPVNELALSKYNDVQTEFNNYNDQLAKLEEERTKILDVIKEIDDKKMSAITEVMTTLNEVFEYVFNSITGGSAKLEFENPQDVLNSGIEIVVDLPNKKVHTIQGLSGGEKSIVSLALIIAISKYVNAQFYVLDEVDAALDQSNSARFSSLIRTYSNTTQFIVISHNETTLINADRAYGVVMDENGISKVVSINVSEKAKSNLDK